MLLCSAFFMGETQLFAAIAPTRAKSNWMNNRSLSFRARWLPLSQRCKNLKLNGAWAYRDRIYSIKLELVKFHKIPPFEQDLRFKEFIVVRHGDQPLVFLPCRGHKAMSRS